MIDSGLTNVSYIISGLNSSTYYIVVVAYNKYGFTVSNCVKFIVELPELPDDPEEEDTEKINISGFPTLIIFISVGVGLIGIIFWKKGKSIS